MASKKKIDTDTLTEASSTKLAGEENLRKATKKTVAKKVVKKEDTPKKLAKRFVSVSILTCKINRDNLNMLIFEDTTLFLFSSVIW